MKYNIIETILGAFVIIVAVLFVLFGIKTNKIDTNEEMTVVAIFEDVAGLKIGDNIKLSGVNIGKIEDLKLDVKTFEAKVFMKIDKLLNLPDDTSARITSSGLLGGNYIEITPGISETILKDNSLIYDTSADLSFSEMIGKMIFSNNEK